MAPHGFNHSHAEVVKGVVCAVKMCCYWLLHPPMQDVAAVSVEADVEGVLCLPHVLLLALPALNEVDYILCLAGGHGTYVKEAAVGCAVDSGAFLDVVAGAASSAVTAPASSCWVWSSLLQFCTDQKITKLLWSAVGYHGLLRDGFL